ncbi:hypothetical protein CYMTET_20619 [Cymbomonas tetramitiformis]|uniref:Uncharacterized protein n=1 Tax=Cymbomonas tetramitiformis TaxID=36881 RepID=A0AAE0G463_9CHLO|nr:hypothetical protein CYMTET_20619 [Cymbomonas tetramitiformis]
MQGYDQSFSVYPPAQYVQCVPQAVYYQPTVPYEHAAAANDPNVTLQYLQSIHAQIAGLQRDRGDETHVKRVIRADRRKRALRLVWNAFLRHRNETLRRVMQVRARSHLYRERYMVRRVCLVAWRAHVATDKLHQRRSRQLKLAVHTMRTRRAFRAWRRQQMRGWHACRTMVRIIFSYLAMRLTERESALSLRDHVHANLDDDHHRMHENYVMLQDALAHSEAVARDAYAKREQLKSRLQVAENVISVLHKDYKLHCNECGTTLYEMQTRVDGELQGALLEERAPAWDDNEHRSVVGQVTLSSWVYTVQQTNVS